MQARRAPATELSSPVPVRVGSAASERARRSKRLPLLIVAAITALGATLRLIVGHQSLFGDELSTDWIISTHGLRGVVSEVATDAEITPPLYFTAAWLATRIGHAPELLRGPSLLGGIATIPLVYLVGIRTVGRRAAIVAATLTALAPFMIFYSTEARGYALMVALVTLSTLAMLVAVDDGRARWWLLYGAASAAAVYTHYTCVFALAAQLLWLLWAHPGARRAAILANVGAVVVFLPWVPELRGDFNSPTTKILSALQPFTSGFVRTSLEHWSIGYPLPSPTTRLRDLPGVPALVLLALALTIALAGVVVERAKKRSWRGRLDSRLVLVVALALSVPLGEALVSAIGTNLFGTRNLAASWPGFALVLAALLVAAGPTQGLVAATLAVASFAIGAGKMLQAGFQRPDARAAAAFIDRHAARGDVVVDGTFSSPAGVPGALEAAFQQQHRVFELGRAPVKYNPFRILGPVPPTADVIHRAAAVAHGGRLFVVLNGAVGEVAMAMPRGYGPVDTRTYPGIIPVVVTTFADRASSRG
jgi:hypothetical protein